MRPAFSHSAMLVFAIVVTHGLIGHSQSTGASWLDQAQLPSWNASGGSLPAAPDVEDVNPKCRELERPSQIAEDARVRERGWSLVGAFQGGWDVLVIRGTASFDGMCRPLGYQDFVFVRGVFAGTLSPEPMNSRDDGAIGSVYLQGPTRLMAVYVRYEESDARCCPSRATQVTFEIAGDAPDAPVVRPVAASTTPKMTAADQPSRPASESKVLAGTAWQLVKFEGGDGTVLTPDDRAKYTIELAADGRVSARIDCNRGRGTWTSTQPGHIELGPLALTRAMCPPDSLHDQIVRQWGNVRSYVIEDGHLFLALRADGGIYELEPIAPVG